MRVGRGGLGAFGEEAALSGRREGSGRGLVRTLILEIEASSPKP